MNNLIDNLGGRKFVLTILAGIAELILVLTGRIDPAVFLAFLSISIATYTVGNVAEKMGKSS